MTAISLATDDWESASENVVRMKLRNMYIAEDPTTPDGITRVGRPTLSTYMSVGSGPIKGMFLLNGALGIINGAFVVSGNELYLIDTVNNTSADIGAVTGTGYCTFAATEDRVLILRDGIVYSATKPGSTVVLSTVAMPDSLSVGSVASINSYFILSVLSDNRFYWIPPGGTDPDPLNFASAERYPDPIVSTVVSMDEIWFIGAKGPEVWQATGDINAPFQRITARDYNEGCASVFTSIPVTASNGAPGIIWVTPAGAVVIAQAMPIRISNESVEELLRGVNLTTLRAYGFRYNRHDFYLLTCSSWTLAYDITKRSWSRWDTGGLNFLRAHLGFQSGTTVYGGDYSSGQLYTFVEGKSDNGVALTHELSGGIINPGKPMPCGNVTVRASAGFQSGDPTPTLSMRWSDDQGKTWSNYVTSNGLGPYLNDVTYRSLGLIVRPGRIFEWMFTDASRIRFDYAAINEA